MVECGLKALFSFGKTRLQIKPMPAVRTATDRFFGGGVRFAITMKGFQRKRMIVVRFGSLRAIPEGFLRGFQCLFVAAKLFQQNAAPLIGGITTFCTPRSVSWWSTLASP